MLIHQNFDGGNIKVVKQEENTVYLENELRDTIGDWFYWAFCVEDAQGQTLTFKFQPNRLGYFGPAVSYDLENWHWLGENPEDENSFTYTFGENESKVYFAHDMYYHPDRFARFAASKGIEIKELCKSRKGRSVPFVTFGDGEEIILMTARHHACESTGNYVMEGVIDELVKNPVPDTKVVCVPFVDLDGVLDGDQGKARAPYDHNRDYVYGKDAIYPEVAEIRKIADKGIRYGFDFHSPWHKGKQNDTVFIVEKRAHLKEHYRRFGRILEDKITDASLKYDKKNTFPVDFEWNSSKSCCFGAYMNDIGKARIAFTLETMYFGTPDNVFSAEKAVECGRCFAKAVREYDKDEVKITFTGDLMCKEQMTKASDGNYDKIFDGVKSALADSDYLVGNLETPVAGEEFGLTNEMYCFNTPESYLASLKKYGFRLLALANNHALDRGEDGLSATIANCKKYGFDTVGAYASQSERDAVMVKDICGIKVAFINYTYGVNSFAHHRFLKNKYMVNLFQPEETLDGFVHLLNSNEQIEKDVKELYYSDDPKFESIIKQYLDKLKSDIENAKKQADYVIMISHCGGQYNSEVDAYTKYVDGFIKKCGADVIVGHHPHIIQKSDITDGYLTAYSIGNFIGYYAEKKHDHEALAEIDPKYSVLLNLYLTKNEGKVSMRAGFKLLKVEMVDGFPRTFDTYEMYDKTQDEALKKDILFFANRFVNADVYTDVKDEYFIEL